MARPPRPRFNLSVIDVTLIGPDTFTARSGGEKGR
jgi:hypothetical protein